MPTVPARTPRSRLGRGLLGTLFFLAFFGVDPVPKTPLAVGAQGAGDVVAATSAPSAPTLDLRRTHLDRLGVLRWHEAGYRGQGVKIAVLDSGFRGYRSFLGKGLPPRPLVKSFRKDGNLEARDSQHGILCAEIIHAIAPDAELLFANWETDQPESFLEAARWAQSQGARIFSCSLIMPSWSDGEGGGPVHAALTEILGTGQRPRDLLCFASAGNTAQRHWHGAFRPDADGRHQWAKRATSNRIIPWGSERVAVELYGSFRGNYDVQVIESKTGKMIGQSGVRRSGGWATAVVRFEPAVGTSYELAVRATEPGASDEPFHVVVLGGSLEHATRGGSIPFPGDGARVQAVGAVDSEGERLFYSSCGPNSKRLKPDLVAAVPFPSLCRARPFGGTSAAAPQAAALAALWRCRHPDWSANQIGDALHKHARDLGPAGHDFETGFGLINLP